MNNVHTYADQEKSIHIHLVTDIYDMYKYIPTHLDKYRDGAESNISHTLRSKTLPYMIYTSLQLPFTTRVWSNIIEVHTSVSFNIY